MEVPVPRGDKSSYSDKQKRVAEHIEEGYEKRGVSEGEAERRAWATVNKETHGGKKSGSGRGKSEDHSPSRKGGHLGGKACSPPPLLADAFRAGRPPVIAPARNRVASDRPRSNAPASILNAAALACRASMPIFRRNDPRFRA
jgi:hypothetical protein